VNDDLVGNVVLLVLGFVLTTIVGGVLGYSLQDRLWKRQNRAKMFESERATATKLFEDLSRLMDKRLYRMRQVYWKLQRHTRGAEELESQMAVYRELLSEWNDSLNRNLALTEAYFGPEVRSHLEGKVYEGFSSIGRLLEDSYRADPSADHTRQFQSISRSLTGIGAEIYMLNARMISQIQRGRVGIFMKDPPPPVL
jgi:hypothetical protein